MKKVFALFLCVALMLVCLPATVSAATEIKSLSITMELPDPGKAPTTTAACGTGYSIYAIDWLDRETDKFLEPGEKLQGGHRYYAYLWVKANDGYQFASKDDKTPNVTVTVNNQKCTATKAYEYTAPAMVYVEYSVNVPKISWIRHVDLTIPAPQVGEKPSYPRFEQTAYQFTNMVALPEYVNGINWVNTATEENMDPNSTFQAGVQYRVDITIEQQAGYAFVPQPDVKVNGQVASSSLDHGSVLIVTATFPALEDTHTHTPSDWRITGAYHYTTCTECGDFLDQEDHRWSPTYLYQDKTGHAWVCADCKATGEIFPHIPGPAGTPGAAAVCRDCGYILEPAKDHEHDLSRVPQTPADCINGGNIEYYFCTGCNDCFTDAEGKNKIPETMSVLVGALGHKPADNWSHDEADHWRICSSCKALLDETKMRHSFEAGKCTTCGYEDGASIETLPTEVTQPTTTPATAPEQPAAPKTMGWPTVILIGLVCFGAAITATVIILKKKKKV